MTRAAHSQFLLAQVLTLTFLFAATSRSTLAFMQRSRYPVPIKLLTVEEIAALPMVGKPESEWRKQGFSTYVEWWESPSEELKRQNQDKENRKQKLWDELEKSEKSTPKLQSLSEPDGPTLLYRGVITEL